MKTIEILDLLFYFVDGTELKKEDFLILEKQGYIEQCEPGAWILTEYGKKIFNTLKYSNY